MNRTILSVILALAASSAQAFDKPLPPPPAYPPVAVDFTARCIGTDSWRGADKVDHAAVGFTIGMMGSLATESRWAGFAMGVVAGAAKELNDRRTRTGQCSLQDFAITAAGAAAGAWGSGFLLVPKRNGVTVAYVRGF